MTNLWEDLETGPDAPDVVYAVVECLKGERNKYEYDKDVPGVVLDRVLHSRTPSTSSSSSRTRRSRAASSRPAQSR